MRYSRMLLTVLCLLVAGASSVNSEGEANSLAYKLAILQERARSPESVLMGKQSIPRDSEVQEFRWIMTALEGRCLNPPGAIADTIIEMWNVLQQRGLSLTILDVAHKLHSAADTAYKRENKKINFIITSRYWLKHNSGTTAATTAP